MKIAIIGAGIAGLTTAVALKEKNIDTVLFEASAEIKAVGAGLGLAANAIKAFDVLGLKADLIHRGRLLNALTIYDHYGKVITNTGTQNVVNKYGEDNFTIHRADLHAFLCDQLPQHTVYTGKRLTAITQDARCVTLQFHNQTSFTADYVIVADGVHSTARQQLIPNAKPRYAGYTCWRAVINHSSLQTHNVSEIWGPKGRFGIVPLKADSIYWFACINSPRNNPELKKYKVQDLLNQFNGYPAEVEIVLKETKDKDLIWNDIIDLNPIDRFAFGRIVLIGDAAHATTPNMGQGACQAIEDAVCLAEAMTKHSDFQNAFRAFERLRLKRVHWVTHTSWKLGKVAQLSNPVLSALRNAVFRVLPASFSEKQLEKLYDTRFS